jgi:site-specific DNA-methyltransferase (adenine-specific)
MNQKNQSSDVNYNPDVLTCLANLSNDEVFTPPNLVNNILNLLPKELWSNPDAKFLDPVSKSGVFLREIAKRLMTGLEKKIPNKQKRINHIFENQLYGIAITELTALLSRRSVYCSKTANGKYAVCETFDNEQGNISYERMQHTWENRKCTQCGASQEVYDRGDEAESYAYNFIHTENPAKLFASAGSATTNKKLKKGQEMKFDVIVGNPPYQLSDGGAQASAIPLYHKFVQQAKKLNPKYLTMIIPARWYSGGRGLDEFREEMLSDKRTKEIHDFPNTADCFPGVNIRGGVCYFLWDANHKSDCKIYNHKGEGQFNVLTRPMKESKFDIFIRHNEAITIVNKVVNDKEKTFEEYVSSLRPFGFRGYFVNDEKFNQSEKGLKKPVMCYGKGRKVGYVEFEEILNNKNWIDRFKVFTPRANNIGTELPDDNFNTFIGKPNSICTESYLVLGADLNLNNDSALNLKKYFITRFARFLHSVAKSSQDATSKTFRFVPLQDFTKKSEIDWSKDISEIDIMLYKKYGFTKEEVAFIESMIRPMDVNQAEE